MTFKFTHTSMNRIYLPVIVEAKSVADACFQFKSLKPNNWMDYELLDDKVPATEPVTAIREVKQVKIISESTTRKLEYEVNAWLEGASPHLTVLDIQFTHQQIGTAGWYTAFIKYK